MPLGLRLAIRNKARTTHTLLHQKENVKHVILVHACSPAFGSSLLIVISMSCRMTTTRFLLSVLRLAARQHVHATATRSCSSRSMDRYFGYHVPIRKPPPESPAANINRITDSTDPLTEDVDPEFLDSIAPELPIAYNLAAFVNRSPSLQQLVRLGVDLSVVEKDAEIAEMLLRLDFERDMKPHIQALVDLGIKPDDLGPFITENPAIFEVSINNMKARVEYLRSKKFPQQVHRQDPDRLSPISESQH